MLTPMFKGALISGLAVLLAAGSTWPDVASQLVSVLGTVLLAWIAYRQFLASRLQQTTAKKLDENTAVTKEIQEKVNGKTDQLIHAEKTASFLAGKKMGEIETTHRLQDSGEIPPAPPS